MLRIKSLFASFFIVAGLGVVLPTGASALPDPPLDSPKSEIHYIFEPKTAEPKIKIEVETRELSTTPLSQEQLAQLVESKTHEAHQHVVLSTDNALLIKRVLQNKRTEAEHLTFVPLENSQTDEPDNKFLQVIKSYGRQVKESVENDKFGALIVTYTTASETLVWIHSTNLTQFERTSNVVYTVALALVFNLNKDKWAQTTRPIQKFFRNLIKPESEDPTNFKELSVKFFGNLSLAMLVTSGRIPLLSMSDIISRGIQLHYFSVPLLMSVVSTAAAFTWSEHIAMINKKTHPISKFIFNRVNEGRWILIGTFATTAALLNPVDYGLSPWLTLGAVGAAGALIYFNAEKINTWIENRPILQRIFSRFAISSRPRCEALFGD